MSQIHAGIVTCRPKRFSVAIEKLVKMNTSESYAFGEWFSKLGRFNYTVGLGVMRTYLRQAYAKQEKYIMRPTVQIGYRFGDHVNLRYKAYIGGYAPSLSDLSDVEQQIDIYQIRRGNPNLHTVTFYTNELSLSVDTKYISAEWFTRYSYDDKPFMEETTYENGMYIRTYDNQKGFHRLNSQISLRVRPYKEYVSIQVTPFVNRYISMGNSYTHTHTNWGVRGNMMAMYKNWYIGANVETSFHNLWGETLTRDEASHSVVVGYNKERWGVELQLSNIFSSRYEMSTENLSSLAPYKQMVCRAAHQELRHRRWYHVGSEMMATGSIAAYRTGILAYYKCRSSNAKVKGINNKIKVSKRNVCGYRTLTILC